jgi:hypothetical protein
LVFKSSQPSGYFHEALQQLKIIAARISNTSEERKSEFLEINTYYGRRSNVSW